MIMQQYLQLFSIQSFLDAIKMCVLPHLYDQSFCGEATGFRQWPLHENYSLLHKNY